MLSNFEWHEAKNLLNQQAHGIAFEEAQHAFLDPDRLVVHDEKHSSNEERWFCIGKVDDRVLTVRFTYRHGRIRIIGAGVWRFRLMNHHLVCHFGQSAWSQV